MVYNPFRILTAGLDDTELRSLASQSGVVITGNSQDASGLDIEFPTEAPPGAPRTGEIIGRLRTVVLPEIVAALESLDRIPNDAEIRFDLMHLPHQTTSPMMSSSFCLRILWVRNSREIG